MSKESVIPNPTDMSAAEPFERELAARIPGLLADDNLLEHQPEVFHEQNRHLHFGMAYVGTFNFPLGVLVALWKYGEWTADCPHCGAGAYIFYAGGSPLSGMHSYRAICPACRACSTGRKSSFSSLTDPARTLLSAYTGQFPGRRVR